MFFPYLGLTEAIELSQTLRAQHAPELSQADFNVLLGTEATKLGIDKSRRGINGMDSKGLIHAKCLPTCYQIPQPNMKWKLRQCV